MRIKFYFPLKYIPLFFLCLVFLMSSCSNKKSILFKTKQGVGVKSSVTEVINNIDSIYFPVIKPGDNLIIKNLENESLINGLAASTPIEVSYRVDENGMISLPIIGRIKLEGLNIDQAVAYITKEYQKTALVNPLFDIKIDNENVTLIGEFYKQGNFELKKLNTSLVEIIGEAGGFNNRANKTNIKIIRGDKKNPEIIEVDLTNIVSLASPKLQLRNGDIIYSEPRNIYMFSDKFTPFLAYIGIGTTVLSFILLLRSR